MCTFFTDNSKVNLRRGCPHLVAPNHPLHRPVVPTAVGVAGSESVAGAAVAAGPESVAGAVGPAVAGAVGPAVGPAVAGAAVAAGPAVDPDRLA